MSSKNSSTLLEISGLTTEFPTEDGVITAVDGVDLSIETGEILGLVGESGAGKSVTAHSILQLIESPGRITEGTIEFKGVDLRTKSKAELRKIRGGEISMIFQDPLTSLNPVYTVGSQIQEAIELHQNVSEREARTIAIDMLAEVGISDPETRVDSYPHELSGGMLQRAMIAMALSCEPDLLIADEPTTALDVTIEAQILDILDRISESFDTSVLLITHDLGVVAEVCDTVGVMYAGQLVEKGPVSEIFKNPRHPYTQGLLASIPSITGDRSSKMTTIYGSVPNPRSFPRGCRFHPRCPYAIEECKSGKIPMEDIDSGHQSRCIRWREINTEWPEETTAELTRGISGDESVIKVDDLQKWFPVEDSIIDRIEFDGSRNGFPIGLKREYVKAVDGISFEIQAGETLGLVGESGCGKSTTAKTLIGLLKANDGDIFVRTHDGERQNITELSKSELRSIRREVQFIFQDPNSSLNPRKTVGKLIGRPMELHGIASGTEKVERIEELLETVGLEPEDRTKYPHEFSGGQQQRIGIARALAVEPEVMIADEPTSALDVSIQAQIINLIMDIQQEMDFTILFIAHDLSVVRHICNRIAVMYLGHIMEIGSVEDVFSPPYHPYTAALLSSIPIPDPDVERERIRLEGSVPSPIDPPSGCPFHTRCPRYIEGECDTEFPPTQQLTDGSHVTCVLSEEELPASTVLDDRG
ncbi:ABC transporter ATP-binding protein [Halorussus salinisoli]|uniref:ABC transporter ATP-binding protein n=1 Tax=Halorussus salinisoli TaxID=2558242 RepID=UPI0010C1772F|nr:ABC transporter ATP-binding protein [Halorussus salinisoli]